MHDVIELRLQTERQSQLVDITRLVRDAVAGRDGLGGARLRAAHDGRRDDQRARRPGASHATSRRRSSASSPTDWTWQHDREGRGERADAHPRGVHRVERADPAARRRRRSRSVPGRGSSSASSTGRASARSTSPSFVALILPAPLRSRRPMAAPVSNGEELELHIDSLAYGGNGVARLNGFVVFVRRALPGDRVRARVTKVKRGFAEATRPRRCSSRARTGSRRRAGTSVPAAAAGSRTTPTSSSSRRRRRRCATRSSVSGGSSTRRSSRSSRPSRSSTTGTSSSTRSRRPRTALALGFHRAGRWDEVLAIDECLLTTDLGNAIRDAVRAWAREEELGRVRPGDHEGYLRHLVVREGRNTGQALVMLVTAPGRALRDRLPRRGPPSVPGGALRSTGRSTTRPRRSRTCRPGCSGATTRSRRRSSVCASACGRTHSCRRTPRWPSGSTRPRASSRR